MSEVIGIILKIIDLKARIIFAIWLIGALLIFLPDQIKTKMAVTIPEPIRPYIGFITLVTFVLWIVLATVQIVSILKKIITEKKVQSEILDQLKTLSTKERDIFIFCLMNKQTTIHRNIVDGAVNSLLAKCLLSTKMQGNRLAMPFIIPTFVWKHLQRHKDFLFPEISNPDTMNALLHRQQHGWMGN